MVAVRGHGTPLVEDPARLAGVSAVGVDETAFLRANAHRHTQFVTGGSSTSAPAARST